MTVALSAVGRQGESLNVFIQYLTLKKKKKKRICYFCKNNQPKDTVVNGVRV